MDARGDVCRGFSASIENDFQLAIVIDVGQDWRTDKRVVVGDHHQQEVARGIEDVDAATSVAVSGEHHDLEDAVVVDVADGGWILCHAPSESLCPEHIALSVNHVEFLVMAEDDFVGAVIVEVGQSQSSRRLVGSVGTEAQGEAWHG